MKSKFNYKNIIVILIVITILTISLYLNKSYGYDIEDLNKGDILIGNNIYNGYISPNKLITSSIN